MLKDKKITVITPTTGKHEGIMRLKDSLRSQEGSEEIYQIILWDDKREENSKDPQYYNDEHTFSIYIPGNLGKIWGSHLRACGLIMAQTDWVTWADDDVWWEKEHYQAIKYIMSKSKWGGVRRIIHNPFDKSCIGVDNFESVGLDRASSKVDYEFLDGNTMVCEREFGVYASPLYREVTTYSDDRTMYNYLKECAGEPVLLLNPTINQICPQKLTTMFVDNCTPYEKPEEFKIQEFSL